MPSAPEFRSVRTSDAPAVAAALGVSEEEWRWLYEANPARPRDDGVVTAAAAFGVDGAVLAHYGAASRRVMLGGKERRVAEITHTFENAPGHLALSAKGFFNEFAGPRGQVILYGWPDDPRLSLKLLEFEVVRTENLLEHDGTSLPNSSPNGIRIETIERFDEQARWLYDRCAGGFGSSAIRDADFLNWRFVDRPGFRYTVLGARDRDGILRGYAVLAGAETGRDARARPDEPWPGRPLLVDWLVPTDEPHVGERLLGEALAWARNAGALATSLPPWSPWFESFQRAGFRVRFDARALVAKSFVRKYDDLWLRDNAWFTFADWISV